jgi:hypothetical protein
MRFIFRSDTLGVSGCVLVMCLRFFVVVACACYMLWFKQYIYDACGNKEHQQPNNMYYELQAWKYNEIPEI